MLWLQIEREQLEREFADVHCDMTTVFLKAMADSQILNEEQLSTAKINEIYGPLKDKVSETIKKQESCLAEVEVNTTVDHLGAKYFLSLFFVCLIMNGS